MALKFGSPAWRKKYAPKKRKNSKRRTTRRASARRKTAKRKNPRRKASAASTLRKIKALVRKVK